ncbi:MAG: ankyrin repeat domain-containing protein [Spirochaetota bacterium]
MNTNKSFLKSKRIIIASVCYTLFIFVCMLFPNNSIAQIHNDETQLYQACIRGDIEETNRLLKSGASVNERNTGVFEKDSTPVFGAIYSGNEKLVKLLIDHGAKINIYGNDNQTPLHAAAYWHRPRIAELLIKQGAKVNAVSSGDQYKLKAGTALHVATERAVHSMDEMMRIRDIYKSECENDKYYKILKAMFKDSVDVIRILLDNGADANIQRPGDGFTQLHILSNVHSRGHHYTSEAKEEILKLVKLGAEHGADAELLSNDKKTAIYYAALNRNDDVESFLKEKSDNVQDKAYSEVKVAQKSQFRQNMFECVTAGALSLMYISLSIYCYEHRYKNNPDSNPMVKFNTYLTTSALFFGITTFIAYELFMNLDKSSGFAKGAASLMMGIVAGLCIGVPAAIIITKKYHFTEYFGDNRGLYYAAPVLSMAIPIFMFTHKF